MVAIVRCTVRDIKVFFQDKEYFPCPLTEKLVKAGYQQKSGGYIDRAKSEGLEVDYKHNKPSQYWHLMSYCESRDGNKPFSRSIVCGELIFWMAEVSGCVPKISLQNLAERIVGDIKRNVNGIPVVDRIKWNKEIHDLCFDSIVSEIRRTEK